MAGSWLGFGQHGHSHDNGSKCAGHSHGAHSGDISESNPFLFGYGHEAPSPPQGWDSLIVSKAVDELTWSAEKPARKAVSARDNFWLFNIPFLGRLRVVKDANGMMMSSLVILSWMYGNWVSWSILLLPHYYDGNMPSIVLIVYTFMSAMCIISFFFASTLNPGTLHQTQIPQDGWTECKVCLQMRPPLSHHCRRCGQCVRRMDHHCPWINNCVGEENQYAFLLLLIYACLLNLFGCVLLAVHYYWLGGICISCDHESFVIRYQIPIFVIGVVMASFVVFSMSDLLFTQHVSIIRETTTIEWMKIQQQIKTAGILPEKMPEQTKSCYQIYSLVCGTSLLYVWPFPFRRNFQMSGKACVV